MKAEQSESKVESDGGDGSASACGDRISAHLLKRLSTYGGAPLEDASIETVLVNQVDAAPEPLRSYVRALEQHADPASNLRELVYAREERKMLGAAILELEQAILRHRDTRGPARETGDLELYLTIDLSGGDSCPS